MNKSRRTIANTPAFTLIEVLMAVFILALGLLGIGALFPAVISLQRAGADATFGTLSGQSAQSYLAGHSYLPRDYWDWWARLDTSTLPAGGMWMPIPVDAATGWAVIGQDDANTPGYDDRVYLPLADRLYPGDSAGAPEPLLVWDMAVRRVSDGSNRVQVAVFSRRVDPKIRVARGASLYDAMTNLLLPDTDRRWPVSEDNTGVATLDGAYMGTARYSAPFTCQVRLSDPRIRDSLQLVRAPSGRALTTVLNQLSQPGQRIVDNYGNVYMVEGLDTRPGARNNCVRISPEVPPDSNQQYPVSPSQIIMTPQTPASVVVFTVNP